MRPALRPTLSPPVRAALITAAIGALVAWTMGTSVVHMVMVAAAFAAVALMISAMNTYTPQAGWSTTVRSVRAGGRMDVAFQTWRLTGVGNSLNPAELTAVRVHVTASLLARGLDPSDPRDRDAIRHLLGARVTALLYPRTPSAPWRHHDV